VNARLFKNLPVGPPDDLVSSFLRFALTLAASLVLSAILKWTWEKSVGEAAPTNPSRPGVGWRDALVWGLVSGALAGTVKVAARRGSDRLRS
jgi:hypothetical protein